MKISYNSLKRYIKNIDTAESIAENLIMHSAEVDELIYSYENLKNVVIGEIIETKKHPDSKKLNLCKVNIKWDTIDIVCWASNVKKWLKVAVALVWAKLNEDFTIKKTKILWYESNWMICSEDELWLVKERQSLIMEIPNEAEIWVNMRDYLWKNEIIIDINNKAINHRPDLFSHIWFIREIHAIYWKKFDFNFEKYNFSKLNELWIDNQIEDKVRRYIWVKVLNVSNITSPSYIKEILDINSIETKWLLVDLSNYSLYFYWQASHIFDADKIKWKIIVRYAKDWEEFLSLEQKKYILNSKDIIIADEKKVLALCWIIWWYDSKVDTSTKNIIIESANFDQELLRKTWKRLWIRTDSLNVFEKEPLQELAYYWVSLIINEIKKYIPEAKIDSYTDSYKIKQKEIYIDYDLNFINRLIWNNYKKEDSDMILTNLWIEIIWNKLKIPDWRKDLNYKADIAEEIARIDWYDKIKSQIANIQIWAVIQSNIYKIKNIFANYFINNGFFEIYNNSFINERNTIKAWLNIKDNIALKNYLSEDYTHLKNTHIVNLLQTLEKNIIKKTNIKVFEIEKIYLNENDIIKEKYYLTWLISKPNIDILYYEVQNYISDLLREVKLDKITYKSSVNLKEYSHKKRSSKIIVRWREIWYIWEINPKIANNFWIKNKVWFFEINIEEIENIVFNNKKAKEFSNFQTSNFDLSIVIEWDIEGNEIKTSIEKTDTELIDKVELLDIYTIDKSINKRSLSFKIYISNMKSEIKDTDKARLIDNIIQNLEKKWWKLR